MVKSRKAIHKSGTRSHTDSARSAVLGISLTAIAAVPLAISTRVHRFYSTPKIALLLVASAILLLLITYVWCVDGMGHRNVVLKRRSRYLVPLFVYIGIIGLSTLFGTVPGASLLGSFENQMGLITHVCFLTCCVGLARQTT